MEGHLCELTGCDERRHRHHAPVAWREIRSQPEIAEQYRAGVLDQASRHRPDVVVDDARPSVFRHLIEREQFRLSQWKLGGFDATRLENAAMKGSADSALPQPA